MSEPFIVPSNARSWIDVDVDSEFPVQNLPFGLACVGGDTEVVVVRIGEFALQLSVLAESGLLSQAEFPILHSLIDLDQSALRRLRIRCFELLTDPASPLRSDEELRARALLPCAGLELMLPVEICSFVDFYSGIHHASNVGKMFRPDQPPLLPNYRHMPVAYNGRASSVVISGTPITRPRGQVKNSDDPSPLFIPTRELDFELEFGFFIGRGNELGEPIATGRTADHILGFVLVNDWSARDVQRWEYQPLGPFLAKSFATSISPWIVVPDALEPFRCEGQSQDPPPLPHLSAPTLPHYDLKLEVSLKTPKMRRPQSVSVSNANFLYWSCHQQLAHLTSNGANVEAGDLCASGTISGPSQESFGSLLELTWKGTQPLHFAETGEYRTFLEDGDQVIFRGYGQGDGFRVGFGEAEGTVLPSK